jgi:hypothetical protein
MFTPSSLQKVSQPTSRFPQTGPLGRVPRRHRYYPLAPIAQPPSCRTSLPSLGTTLPLVHFALADWTASGQPGRLLTRRPHRVADKERLSPPRFLGDPCNHALLSDPGGVRASGHCQSAHFCLPPFPQRRLHIHSFEAQSHGLVAPCVRFAGGVAPTPRNTRFRWMASPFRFGTFTRRVTIRGFRSLKSFRDHPPLPGFAWRKKKKSGVSL